MNSGDKDFDFIYDKRMSDSGLVICVLPLGDFNVSYHYTRKQSAGPQVGWRKYSNGERLPVHAVANLEGDSYSAMGRLLNPIPRPVAETKEPARKDWGI